MKKTNITFSEFYDGFSHRRDNFSYDGLRTLYDFFNEEDEISEKETEFDPISICCDWTEWEDLDELRGNYEEIETMEDVEDRTFVLKIDDKRFLTRAF